MNYEVTYVNKRPDTYKSKIEQNRKKSRARLMFHEFYFFSASGDFAMVSMMNNIASTHSPVPGLTQDDSAVRYCNANNLPDHSDKDLPDGHPVYYCPHLIPLELGEVYELLLQDDECMNAGKYFFLSLF